MANVDRLLTIDNTENGADAAIAHRKLADDIALYVLAWEDRDDFSAMLQAISKAFPGLSFADFIDGWMTAQRCGDPACPYCFDRLRFVNQKRCGL